MSVFLGSINNHLDVDTSAPKEGDVLTFIRGKWRGLQMPTSPSEDATKIVEVIRDPDMSVVDPLRKAVADLQVRAPTESKLKRMIESEVSKIKIPAPDPTHTKAVTAAPPAQTLEAFKLRPSVEPSTAAVVKTSRGQVLKTGKNCCFWFYIVLKADKPDLIDEKITVSFSPPVRYTGPKRTPIAGAVTGFTDVTDSLLDKLSLTYENGKLQVQFQIESHADLDIWTVQGSGSY